MALGIVMSMVMNGKALKCSAACSAGMLTAWMPRWRAMDSAMLRTGMPASVAPRDLGAGRGLVHREPPERGDVEGVAPRARCWRPSPT